MLGQLSDFLNTSAITDLSFLGSQEDGYPERLNQGKFVFEYQILSPCFYQFICFRCSCSSLLGRALVAVVLSEDHVRHQAVGTAAEESASSHVLSRSHQEDAFD